MAKQWSYASLYILALIMVFGFGRALTSSHTAENAPLLSNVEEYTVFTAVLFPANLDIAPDSKADPGSPKNFNAQRMYLDGITGNDYRLSRFTISGAIKSKNGFDQEMTADYNRRNEQIFCLDEKRLLPLIPKDGSVVLVDPGDSRIMGKDIITSTETTYISRPGFNQDMTRAMLQINHVAGPEMGVGYQVYLDKSPLTGTWKITGFDLNRIY